MTSETTPLLAAAPPAADVEVAKSTFKSGLFSARSKVMFTSFLLSLAFSFTQTPLLFSVRLMGCETWWEEHPDYPWDGQGDRCSVKPIESLTARNAALMGTMTTSATIINLFWTGYLIKKRGVQAAMSQQTLWAAFRNVTQLYALTLGGQAGVSIMQFTQLFNILGGAGGYLLCSNAYIGEIVSGEERTAAFGALQGYVMLARAVGFTSGGIVADTFRVINTFQITLGLLIFSTLFSFFFLPYIAPLPPVADAKKAGWFSFLDSLKVFLPRKVDGQRRWSLFALGVGEFLAVLSTGFVPTMLQLVAVNLYGFHSSELGYMMSLTFLVRALFLTLAFPRVIKAGRRLLTPKPKTLKKASSSSSSITLPADNNAAADSSGLSKHQNLAEYEHHPEVDGPEDHPWVEPVDVLHGSTFDLRFLKGSLLLDGILTGCCLFCSRSWHIYLAAVIIPLASGTSPASKGVILEMVKPSERSDAIASVALLERLGTIGGIGLFGQLFATLSEAGHPTWVFTVNAGTALLGTLVLMFVRLPKVTTAGRGQAAA